MDIFSIPIHFNGFVLLFKQNSINDIHLITEYEKNNILKIPCTCMCII